jgi:hypothetical protein
MDLEKELGAQKLISVCHEPDSTRGDFREINMIFQAPLGLAYFFRTKMGANTHGLM